MVLCDFGRIFLFLGGACLSIGGEVSWCLQYTDSGSAKKKHEYIEIRHIWQMVIFVEAESYMSAHYLLSTFLNI